MKRLQTLLFLLCALMLLMGCGRTDAGKDDGSGSTAQSDAKTVKPLPITLSVDALDNCSFAAGFEHADVTKNADGVPVIKLSVYDYELFDMVEISTLKVGDTLLINQASMDVKSLQKDDNGYIIINGGLEDGGCELATNDDGVYYERLMSDAKNYHKIGEATLPLSENFKFEDSSDLGAPERTLTRNDFLTAMETAQWSFSPYATTVTVQSGEITGIRQIFVP